MSTQTQESLRVKAFFILIVLAISCSAALSTVQQVSAASEADEEAKEQKLNKISPLDDGMEEPMEAQSRESSTTSRQSRQYDGAMNTSSTGNYVAMAGDSGAYVSGGQLPMTGAHSSYLGDLTAGLGGYPAADYHDQMVRGYPAIHSAAYPSSSPPPPPPMSSFLSSSSMFPLIGKAFDVSEIICTAIAVAMGAVIVGAPFILIYLFVMNQMGGNGLAVGPNGGSINLTGPTSSTNVSGRKKRQANSISDALFRQLSPFVNQEQLTRTFKMLIDSLAKHQV